jgi:hypothetical protein
LHVCSVLPEYFDSLTTGRDTDGDHEAAKAEKKDGKDGLKSLWYAIKRAPKQ